MSQEGWNIPLRPPKGPGRLQRYRWHLVVSCAVFALICAIFYFAFYRQSLTYALGHDLLANLFIEDKLTITSPNGKRILYISFFDGGATHSGPFKTLISVKDWRHGRTIVTEGFSSYGVRYQRIPFPIVWKNDDEFEVNLDMDAGPPNPRLVTLER